MPLSAKVWSDAVFQRPIGAAALFPAIIADRRAALLCYGLAALDDETLQFLSKSSGAARSLVRARCLDIRRLRGQPAGAR